MSASAICAAALALVAGLALGAIFLHGPAAAALAVLGISGAIPAATGSSSWASNGISESSSGSLFRAVRVRTFDGARQFGGARAPSAPTLAPAAGELRCRNWAATTTIFEPSDAVRAVAALPSWCLVVAADKKGPAAYPLPSRADGSARSFVRRGQSATAASGGGATGARRGGEPGSSGGARGLGAAS